MDIYQLKKGLRWPRLKSQLTVQFNFVMMNNILVSSFILFRF